MKTVSERCEHCGWDVPARAEPKPVVKLPKGISTLPTGDVTGVAVANAINNTLSAVKTALKLANVEFDQ